MSHAMILSGGVAHDFPSLAAEVVELLRDVEVTADVREDFDDATRSFDGVDLLVVNMLRWTMDVERYVDQRERWGLSPSEQSRGSIASFVAGGGALLALHAATICFDDWPEWRSLVGGRWVWGTSCHPPFGDLRVTVYPERHPIVHGLPGGFDLADEAYGFLDRAADVTALVETSHGGQTHPLVWAREYGDGRVVYDALGHTAASYRVPEHRQLLTQAVRWLLEPSE